MYCVAAVPSGLMGAARTHRIDGEREDVERRGGSKGGKWEAMHDDCCSLAVP